MNPVVHVVAAVVVLDVHVVRVAPVEWPGIDESEPVAAIVETPMIVVAAVDVKAVPVAKMRLVVLVGNAIVATFDATSRLGRLRLRLASLGIALGRVRDRMRLLLL